MTILSVFAVRDRAADAFGRPIFMPSTGLAVRSFQDEINRSDADNSMYRHPDDYDLYLLGLWDDQTGKFDLLNTPEQVAIGKQMKTQS